MIERERAKVCELKTYSKKYYRCGLTLRNDKNPTNLVLVLQRETYIK